MSGLGRLVLGTLLAGVLVAGLLLPFSVGIGLASNEVTTAIEGAQADPLDGEIPLRTTFTDASGATDRDVLRPEPGLRPAVLDLGLPAGRGDLDGGPAVLPASGRRLARHRAGAAAQRPVRPRPPQGGSTLTQQYVKNYLYLVEAQTEAEKADAIATTPIRKLREAKMALSLEQTLSKAEILERYLNLVAFGPSQYGAEAASQWFFGVSADRLTLAQAALLAGMVNNPPKYNPLDENHVQDARDRRDLVLDVMVAAGRLSKATAEETKKQDLGLNPNRTRNGCIPADNSATNGFFCQYALDYLAQAGFDAKTVARSGWTVKTTLDPAVMAAAKAAATSNADPTVPGVERIANAVAVVGKDEPRKVLALAANRPYGLDVTKGETVQRLPTTFAPLGRRVDVQDLHRGRGHGNGTRHQRHHRRARASTPARWCPPARSRTPAAIPATMTLAQALATSPNTAFVALEDQVGLQKVAEMAVRLGHARVLAGRRPGRPRVRQRRHGLHRAGHRTEDGLVHPRGVAGQPAGTGQRRARP